MAVDNFAELQHAIALAEQDSEDAISPEIVNGAFEVIHSQLEWRSKALFCAEPNGSTKISKAKVEILDLYTPDEGHIKSQITTFNALSNHLKVPIFASRPDPRHRMIFIRAGSSRRELHITKRMFRLIMVYHNVTPKFWDYILPFGKQSTPRGFHLMGFYSASKNANIRRGVSIHQLGRSGRYIELCYNFKSVERGSPSTPYNHPALAWSIRQCSVHHYFDLETEQTSWIIVKANNVVSDALEAHARLQQSESAHNDPCASPSPFRTSIAHHCIVMEWMMANWLWYISDLEAYLQDKSDIALTVSWDLPPGQMPVVPDNTVDKPITRPERSFSWQSLKTSPKRAFSWSTQRSSIPLVSVWSDLQSPVTQTSHQLESGFDEFGFEDLQNVHFVDEKANDVLVILKANLMISKNINEEYQTLMRRPYFTEKFGKDDQAAIEELSHAVDRIEQDISMQKSRVEGLLHLIAARKSLVNGILQYRSTEANRLYAAKSRQSAEKMETITEEMQLIAQKTQVETVSMRIITWVTLFFLPGTFVSTLMSTPMVGFEKEPHGLSQKNVRVGALKLYLIVSLPLLAMTMLLYWYVFRRQKRKEKFLRDAEKSKLHHV